MWNSWRFAASQAQDVCALAGVVVRYYAGVAPVVRRCLRAWRRRAEAIPDPQLRRLALAKLGGEHLNAQAAAVFATLAPRRARRDVTWLLVSFEVLYDYLDGVTERPSADPLATGRQAHAALAAAVGVPAGPAGPTRPGAGFYADGRDDGGYLAGLAAACRALHGRLPARGAVAPVLARAVERCAEGQTRAHASGLGADAGLRAWAAALPGCGGCDWWEAAAAAASSLPVHAQLALAADTRTTRADARAADRAYFPTVAAASTLLDSLIDAERDTAAGEHSFVAYYDDAAALEAGLGAIVAEGARGARSLRRGGRHAVIATGVAGFYLAAARAPAARRAAAPIAARLSPALMRPTLALVALKRAAARRAPAHGGAAQRTAAAGMPAERTPA